MLTLGLVIFGLCLIGIARALRGSSVSYLHEDELPLTDERRQMLIDAAEDELF